MAANPQVLKLVKQNIEAEVQFLCGEY